MKRFSQRTTSLAVLIVYAILAPMVGLATNETYGPIITWGGVVAGVSFAVLAVAYARGWEPARYVVLVITVLLSGLTNPLVGEFVPASALITPLLALLLAGPGWVIGTASFQLIAYWVRGYLAGGLAGMGPYGNFAGIVIYSMAIIVMVFSRLVVEAALRAARESAQRAEEARAQAEAKSAALAGQAADLSQRNDEQARLLELIAELETPSVSLAEGVVLAPVVGALDSRRAASLTTRLLREVSDRRTRHVVLDIAGVAHIDTEVAGGILRLVQSLRLLGCAVTLTGISVSVASSLSQLGVSFGDVQVARSPQDVLAVTAR